MKTFVWVIVIVVVLLLLYSFTKAKAPVVSGSTVAPKPTNPYLAGLNLLNTIQTTNCGKYGNPPCTIQDLQAAGWTPDQIASAQQASQTTSNLYLCQTFGIGC